MLKSIFYRKWGKIIISYAIFACEAIVSSFFPWFTGFVITRSSLCSRYVDFYEYYLESLIYGAISFFVGVCMLYLQVSLFVCLLIPITIFSLWIIRLSGLKGHKYDTEANEAFDEYYQSLNDRNEDKIYGAWNKRVYSYIKSIDWRTFRMTGNNLLNDLIYIGAIIILILNDSTPGVILATLTYVSKTFDGLNHFGDFYLNCKLIQVANEKIKEDTREK